MNTFNSTVIETERLILSHLHTDDSEFIFHLLNTPTWLKFIGDRGIKNLEDAKNYILNGPVKSYIDNGFGLFITKLKKENIPIGICGLIKRDTLADIDIGFAFLPEFTGKGLGYEAAAATLQFGRDQLRLKRIVAITVKENIISINLLKKIGLQLEKTMRMEGDEEELMLFQVEY
jgi:RimJ/RimL family protein N-acetyltransferase